MDKELNYKIFVGIVVVFFINYFPEEGILDFFYRIFPDFLEIKNFIVQKIFVHILVEEVKAVVVDIEIIY